MPPTILLVDDDPLARRVLALHFGRDERLQPLEARVLQAVDGKRGLEVAAAERPDVVVVDLIMPRMDGFAFCRALRATEHGKRTPLVIISGVYRDPGLTARLLNEVAGVFLPKPIRADDFCMAILRAVRAPLAVAAGEEVGPPPGELVAQARALRAGARGAGETPPPERTPLPGTVEGSLADKRLPRLLLELLESGATGTLVVRRGRMRKDIFIESGRPVGSDSNLRQEALGQYLVEQGIIDDAKLEFVLAEANHRRMRLGAILMDLGWLSEEEVLAHLAGQARRRIAGSLRWGEGEWTFMPGDGFGDHVLTHHIEVERVVLFGLKRSTTFEDLVKQLGRHATRRIVVGARAARYEAVFDAVFGGTVLPALRQGPAIGALMEGPDAEALLGGAEALLASGLAELGDEVARQDRASAAGASADAFSLARLEALAAGIQGAPPGREDGDESVKAAPAGLEGAPAAADQAHGRRGLLRLYLDVRDRSYYELLGVARDADTAAIERAHARAAASWSAEALGGAGDGADAAKVTEVRALYDRALEVLTDAEARREYDRREVTAVQNDAAVEAELAFREGLALLAAEHPAEAVPRFSAAAEARPDQAAYHAYLGWSRSLAGPPAGGRATALAALGDALALDPDLVEGHEFLGRMAAQAGEHATARDHLERALVLDPARAAAFDALAALEASAGDGNELEPLYRRVIHRLGDRAPAFRQRLWRELGDLYARAPGEGASAQIAYTAAARLEPDDAAAPERASGPAAQDHLGDGLGWRESARSLAAAWRAMPTDPQPALFLIEVFSKAGRHDAAALAAGALSLRGMANPEAAALVDQNRPRTLPRLVRTIDAAAFARLRHPDEDGDVEEMLGLLSGEGFIEPVASADNWLDASKELVADAKPEPFGRLLHYVATVLGCQEPPVHVRADLGLHAGMVDGRPSLLVVGAALLDSDDRLELAFRLGRALAFARGGGRLVGATRSGQRLERYFLAALSLAGRTPGQEPAETAEVRRGLSRLAPASAARIEELGTRILDKGRPVDLERWTRALARTASRVALVVCGDLVRVGEAVAAEEGPEAMDDVIDFALSPEYAELLEELTGSA